MNKLVFDKASGIKAIAWLSSLIPSLKDKKYVIEVKQHKNRRSLDANAYCWVLINKLSEKTNISVTEIYRHAIKDIGGVSITSCLESEAVPMFTKAWTSHGMGWQVETFPSKIEGCTNVTAYYGSSVYDTVQMSRLIDSIVAECQEQGIETMTPNELEGLKAQWK